MRTWRFAVVAVHISGMIVATLLSMSRNSWTKDDGRAAVELGAASAGMGALVGWLCGIGALTGATVAITLLALALGFGSLVEFIWFRSRRSRRYRPLRTGRRSVLCGTPRRRRAVNDGKSDGGGGDDDGGDDGGRNGAATTTAQRDDGGDDDGGGRRTAPAEHGCWRPPPPALRHRLLVPPPDSESG